MNKMVIKPFNVVDQCHLPEMSVDKMPTDGDPLEIKGEMYYVCERIAKQQADSREIGVIPLVVRNPANVTNIKEYINCLSIAHRKVLFKDDKGGCSDLESCDEMIIS
jgi:hypothetical protein